MPFGRDTIGSPKDKKKFFVSSRENFSNAENLKSELELW